MADMNLGQVSKNNANSMAPRPIENSSMTFMRNKCLFFITYNLIL